MAIPQLTEGAPAPTLETLIQDYSTLTARLQELQQLQALPALVVKLLAMLSDPWRLEDHGPKGNYYRCVACHRPTHVHGRVHSDDCPWKVAQKQAETLRATGVLPTLKPFIFKKTG